MERLNFGGIRAQVLALSPRNSYILFRLSDRIAAKGIYTSNFLWNEEADNLDNFLSDQFTVYFGADSIEEAVETVRPQLIEVGARSPVGVRRSRRVNPENYPYEVKAVGVPAEYIKSQAVLRFESVMF